MPIGEKQSHRFGPFELDTQCGQLRKDGVGLKLQGQPLQILEILLEKPGQLVTREELRQRLWASDTFVDFDHSLNTAIKKLRQALGDEADTPHYIETLPKRGYRFIGEVAAEENPHASSAIDQPAGEDVVSKVTTTLVDAVLDAASESKRKARRSILIAAVSALLLIAAAGAAYRIAKPEPMPVIVGSRMLTRTGYRKASLVGPVVDRGSVYFLEKKPADWVTSLISIAGGESQTLQLNCCLTDITHDGSQALWDVYNPKRKGCDVWAGTLPTGARRRIIEDGCWPKYDADEHRFFFLRNHETELYRSNVDGTSVERFATIPNAADPHLSPDGSRIRFDAGYGVWELNSKGGNLHRVFGSSGHIFGGNWSPDQKYYFFTGWDGDRWSLWAVSEEHHWWKKAEASQPRPLTVGPMSIGVPAISNDGKQLYAVGTERRGELSVYDSQAAKFVPYLDGSSICLVDFSRDGKWIAYVTYPEGTLWRSRVDGSERRQLTGPPLAPFNPRWSPDGRLIAFTDLSNGDRRQMSYQSPSRIYVVGADGGSPELLLAGYFGDPVWSADGNSIAYHYTPASTDRSGSQVRILDLRTQKSTAVAGSQDMWSPRWSPDGKYLVALVLLPAQKLMLYRFDKNAWEELASGAYLGWPSWSRDSKYVYVQDYDWLVRIRISDHKKARIASLQDFRSTAYFVDRLDAGWFGLTPDGRPLTTRDTGIQELYAFDLEYK